MNASAVWEFVNSPLGVSCVVAVLTFVLGKIFTAKPEWKKLVLEHGPRLMEAVKWAEKQIPDDTPNPGLSRLDVALKYVVELVPKLGKVNESAVKEALTAVHTSAESNGNLTP